MNMQAKIETTDLVTIPAETALEVYTADKGLDPYLAKIKQETDGFIPDTSTKKGRDAIASMAYKVSQSKTYLDKTGKELVDKLKEQPKLVDAERKRMRDYLDELRDSVRKPLTEWEEAEESRIANHKRRIAEIELRLECADLDSAELQSNIDWLTGMLIDGSFEEFELEATKAKQKSLDALSAALVKRQAYEAEQAELARLREEAAAREQKEREERIAREAAEAERIKAAQIAEAERDAVAKREAEAKAAAERRELELKIEAERAQREAIEAQQRAARAAQAERDKIEAEKAQAAAELKAREKDKEHKKTINNKAVADFMAGGLTEECAKKAVTLIARRSISNVTISY